MVAKMGDNRIFERVTTKCVLTLKRKHNASFIRNLSSSHLVFINGRQRQVVAENARLFYHSVVVVRANIEQLGT